MDPSLQRKCRVCSVDSGLPVETCFENIKTFYSDDWFPKDKDISRFCFVQSLTIKLKQRYI